VRRFVVAADLDDLTAEPQLLATFAEAFGPGDEATLVVLAPSFDEDALSARLRDVLATARVRDDACPDVLALAGEAASAVEPEVARVVRALLSHRADSHGFLRAPRLGVGEAAALRARAGLPAVDALRDAA
jgi:hypothetical protein